jgi:hypothetical protein
MVASSSADKPPDWVVDRGHDRVVEHVGVDMEPEVVGGARAGQAGERVLGDPSRAGLANRGQVEREERVGNRLATVAGPLLRVAEADDDGGRTPGEALKRAPAPRRTTRSRSVPRVCDQIDLTRVEQGR